MNDWVCMDCKADVFRQTRRRVPFAVTAAAWAVAIAVVVLSGAWWVLVVPLVASLIRMASAVVACPACQSPRIVPRTSPAAVELIAARPSSKSVGL